jgi:predicted  nucleic acid-binding Zn-ribbon protein
MGAQMTDSTSNLDLVRSLEHLAGCLRGALRGAGSANMKITSEDARDVQRAAEVIRLYRMARPAVETNGRITPSADDGVCNHCGLMFSPTSDASKVPCPQPGCSLPKWTRHHYHAGSPEEPKAPPSDVEHLTAALVQQEGVLNECEDLLKEALDENGVDVGFENRLEAYWESSAALADWRTRDLALSSAKETMALSCIWRSGCKHPDMCKSAGCCVPGEPDALRTDDDPLSVLTHHPDAPAWVTEYNLVRDGSAKALYKCDQCGTPMRCGPQEWERQCNCGSEKQKKLSPRRLPPREFDIESHAGLYTPEKAICECGNPNCACPRPKELL